jgi:amino acid adenylation domain-containing protein
MQDQSVFWLSPQQKFQWRVQQEVLGRTVRSVCLASLDGTVDVTRLRSALTAIVSRHEILRTVFHRQAGMKMPFQVVLDAAGIAWECVDWSALNEPEQHARINSAFDAERWRESDSASGPVLSALFIDCGRHHAALILSVPSLCADAASFRTMFDEIAALYGGSKQSMGEAFRYLQFSQWQSDLLESGDDEARQGRAFWEKQLANQLRAPALPFENKTSAPFDPSKVSVPVKLASQLINLGNASDHLLAAWQSLLYRLSGQSAFTAGIFAENREYDELKNAVGCFGRTLPVPVRIENTFTFSDVLRRTSEFLRDATAVQEYFAPEAIGLDGELTSFAFSDLNAGNTAAAVNFTLERVEVVSERFKLKLHVVRRGTELTLEFHYDASRFDRSAVERIAGYYQNLLSAALASPATPVSRLPLLSETERKQLLVEWNQTAATYPADKCLHELFELQAARTPERGAVRCGEQSLSYQELNQASNQLAHYLRQQGVGPDQRVGLCLDRSTSMMVAVLGILKAGGAYVPLNADNPPARLKQQLEGAKAVITESKLAAHMPDFSGTTIVLDRDTKLWASEPKTNPAVNITPENLVYVIYTSGSTGVPKGVAVRHRNLVNYSDFIAKKLRLSEHPQGLQFATVSTLGADLGNTCIYPALISGGSLHIIPHDVATDPQQFAACNSKQPIDVLKIVPSHLSALLQSDEAGKILPRKYLVTGGEALTPTLLEKIFSLNPGCEILNHYGPTETTVGSLTLELKSYDWKNAGLSTIPIGRPIQNTATYILDQNLEPVPVGVAGELYIAGAGVTAGYLGQPEKTAERFITNPFSTDPNARMYRTGDLARYGDDGNIEFLGRGDDQVKIRGFRIELGEIESVLTQHASVKQAVVLARATESTANEDTQTDKRLLAYVVLHRDAASTSNGHGAITPETLRQHLQQQLPDYMVPQAVMLLPKLPLNANGKLDRQALPEPEQAGAQKTYIAPRTATEQTIAEVWAEVLRRDKSKISADDNFFDLGGHSLLATQVVSRLRQRFGVEIPMRAIFDRPSVSELAQTVEQATPLATETEQVSVTRATREAYRASK